jgi:hypothetical protein
LDAGSSWAASTAKTLQIATAIGGATPGSYTPAAATPVYVGVVINGTVAGALLGAVAGTIINGLAPILAGSSSTTGVANAAGLPGTVGALTANSTAAYAYLS